MSAQTREEIAAAASTVAAVSCHPGYRQSTKPGDGMVRISETSYPDRFGGLVTWQVVVTLSQNLADAEKWIDANQTALVAALRDVMAVRRAFPAQLVIDTGTVPALIVEGQREED